MDDEIAFGRALQITAFSWEAISVFMRTKPPEECEAHFATVYLGSPTAPFPTNDRTSDLYSPAPTFTVPPTQPEPDFEGPASEEALTKFLRSGRDAPQTAPVFERRMNFLRTYGRIVQHREQVARKAAVLGPEGGREIDPQLHPLIPFVDHNLLRSATDAFQDEEHALVLQRRADRSAMFGTLTAHDHEIYEHFFAILRDIEDQTDEVVDLAFARENAPERGKALELNLLNRNERGFCWMKGIDVLEFVRIRDCLVTASFEADRLSGDDAARLVPTNPDIAKAILEYLTENGLVEVGEAIVQDSE
jgi:hypothetical protein